MLGEPQMNPTRLPSPGAWRLAGSWLCAPVTVTHRAQWSELKRVTAWISCHLDVCSTASGVLKCSGCSLKGRAAHPGPLPRPIHAPTSVSPYPPPRLGPWKPSFPISLAAPLLTLLSGQSGRSPTVHLLQCNPVELWPVSPCRW